MSRLLRAEVERFHLDRLDFAARLQIKDLDVARGEGGDAGGSLQGAAQLRQTFSKTTRLRGRSCGAQRKSSATFGLGADAKESVIRQASEQRPDSEGVPAHTDPPVGSVQQNKSKDAVQERRHLLGAEAIVQMEQNLPVHLGLVVKPKLLPQLEGRAQTSQGTSMLQMTATPTNGDPPPPRPGLTVRWL